MQDVMGDIHQGRDYLDRFVHAYGLFIAAGDQLGTVLFAMLAISTIGGLAPRRTRNATAGIVLPLFLFWAFGFSYEIRTASALLPFLALVIGVVLVWSESQNIIPLGGGGQFSRRSVARGHPDRASRTCAHSVERLNSKT